MSETWLIFDVSNLAFRAWHTTGRLSHNGLGTGVIYGVLRDVLDITKRLNGTRHVFCFDSAQSIRREVSPAYKAARTKVDEVVRQLRVLRTEVLPEIGFSNVFRAVGYEADDLIAAACQSLPLGDEAYIVSSDKDLYQCISWGQVAMWNPLKKCRYGESDFAKEYGIVPHQWPQVKAYAGCAGDGVLGIKGVGDVTAAKYLAGLLGTGSKAYWAMAGREGKAVRDRNLPLVKLPYYGCPRYETLRDTVTSEKWRVVLIKYGMTKLIQTYLSDEV